MMGPLDRPLRGHRGPSLIFLGFAQTQNSLREFLVPQFNRIEVLLARFHRNRWVLGDGLVNPSWQMAHM